MGRYIVRRLLIAVPTLLVISFVIYAILALAPIDPLSQFGADPRIPPEARENIRRALGLDQPWPIRYVKWMTAMFTGNFGVSFMSHSPVSELIKQRFSIFDRQRAKVAIGDLQHVEREEDDGRARRLPVLQLLK